MKEVYAVTRESEDTVEPSLLKLGLLNPPVTQARSNFLLPNFFSHLQSVNSKTPITQFIFHFPGGFEFAGFFCILKEKKGFASIVWGFF